jgi:hypothetical protein
MRKIGVISIGSERARPRGTLTDCEKKHGLVVDTHIELAYSLVCVGSDAMEKAGLQEVAEAKA